MRRLDSKMSESIVGGWGWTKQMGGELGQATTEATLGSDGIYHNGDYDVLGPSSAGGTYLGPCGGLIFGCP